MLHALASARRRSADESGVDAGAGRLFARNTAASFFVFGVDIALLWVAVQFWGISQMVAATGAFLIAMTIHYVLARLWVFRGTQRGVATGYAYFLVNAGIGLVVTLGAFWVLIESTQLHYLVARAVASIVAGILVFFLNAIFNFKAL